jgi:hypothetical protein
MTTNRNTPTARTLAALVFALLSVAASALTADSTATEATPTNGCTGPYHWPVKPFDQAHPVRGAFGDPRTTFRGPNSEGTLYSATGVFSFHQGVDISAPDGSPVYAVANGRVTRAHGARVTVTCPNGRSFQYWHVEPTVRVGQLAVAGKTVVGRIQPKREHVHLTHLESGGPVNPLGPGRLTPYRDTTMPKPLAVTFRRTELGNDLGPAGMSGRVLLLAEAIDTPALPVPGRWHGFPVTPALVTWSIRTPAGRVVVARHVARDVRRVVPRNSDFWTTFARGSHQNWPVFTDGKAKGMTGRYVFRLSKTAFDTTKLADGDYELVVAASDTSGNRSVRVYRLTIDNDDH